METKPVKQRLSSCKRQEIIKLYNGSVPVTKIAEQFKVSRPTIYKIIDEAQKDQKKIDFFILKEDKNKDIMEPNTKTNFLGIVIDTENGSNNPRINKALSESFHLLDIIKFIEVTKFKLNMIMFDYFWQSMIENQSSLVGRLVFEWFGYEGEYFNQKKCFKKMLNNNSIEYRELTREDKNIEQYSGFKEELQLLPHEGAKSCSKFIIMDPKNLKRAIMQLKTKNGHIIRDYYIDLEELLKLYVEYTLYFNHRESRRKITDLEKMMVDMKLERQQDLQFMRSLGISLEEVKDQNEELLDSNKGLHKQNKKIQRKLGIAVEDRAPQPENESKRERFVLLKRNDPDYYAYYTIRAQDSYTIRKLKFEKTNFPNLVVLLDFKCSPNSKTLYNRIKETLKSKNVVFKGNNIELEDSQITEEQLIDEMKVINDQKYDV